jgi:hypothetical protein
VKSVWLGITALVAVACGSPQEGGHRFFAEGPDGGGPCGGAVCDSKATCAGTGDAAKCECNPGYEGDGRQCADIDECKTNNGGCDPNANCTNLLGRPPLCKCKDGFQDDGNGGCTVKNDCATNNGGCDPNSVCVPLNPGHSCKCNPGFEANGDACADIDECKDPSLFQCAANAHCENTFGSYECACDEGYTGDGKTACASPCDALHKDPSACADRGLCRVEGTVAVCDACEPGFTGDGKSCAPSSSCGAACDGVGTDDAANTVCGADGTCACAPGYTGTPGSCMDVNECATNNGGCGAHEDCKNQDGGYACTCKAGYARDASGACADIDECAAVPGPCHPDAICTNRTPDEVPAGFECACKPGFTGDGFSCVDVNECATNNGGCKANATCVNERGSFSCTCAAPLVGSPDNCHCDLDGYWAMRQDVDTCWGARLIQAGTAQDLISAGSMEATVWQLDELSYDGNVVTVKEKGCGTDNTPDLVSPLFRETYSSYIPNSVYDPLPLATGAPWPQAGIVPGSAFTTPSDAGGAGIDLGSDPTTAPWPASHTDVTSWVDTDGDGEPGVTLWPRLPSQLNDRGSGYYSYLPARAGIGGTSFYVDQRVQCMSVAVRVITHLEATVESCTRITGTVVNENTQGRVEGCTLVPKGTCDPNNLNSCSGWSKDVTCTAADWQTGTRCSDQDIATLDDDNNQKQNSTGTFELVKLGGPGEAKTCTDVTNLLPALQRTVPTISCTTPQ